MMPAPALPDTLAARRALADLRVVSLLLAVLEAPRDALWVPPAVVAALPEGAPRDLVRWLVAADWPLATELDIRRFGWLVALDRLAAQRRREDVRTLLRQLVTAGRALPVLLGDGRARMEAWIMDPAGTATPLRARTTADRLRAEGYRVA